MRRTDKEITDDREIAAILQKAIVCRLALVDDNTPYIIPVNFAVHDRHLYFHSASEGRKIEILRENNRVCFEVDEERGLIKGEKACSWSMKYVSIIGFGRAYFIETAQEKKQALNFIMKKYANSDLFVYDTKAIDKIIIIDIRIEQLSGKKSG
jgi:uncharacterized protein